MVLHTKKTNIKTKVKIKIGVKMKSILKLFTLFTLYSTTLFANNSENHYDFLQPFMVQLDNNFTQNPKTQNELLQEFEKLIETDKNSTRYRYVNYKIMQNFQYEHYKIATGNHNKLEQYNVNKTHFIKLLKSVKKPSFFTLYSQLYIETLSDETLSHKNVIRLNNLATHQERPYVQLLSYIHGLNQLINISIDEQNTLYEQLKLLLPGLPKEQQNYILRYTALHLLPLYDKSQLETDFAEVFAKNKIIKRSQILQKLNFKRANAVKAYLMKKKRSFLEQAIFDANMNALKRNDVALILTTLYMQDNNFIEARNYIRQAPRENLFSQYNPFNTGLDINNKVRYRKTYSTRTFAETMSRLEEKLDDESVTARDFYLYANGLYNKSWFGNFPMSSVFQRDPYIYKNAPIPPTTNLKKARSAYHDALKRVEVTKLKKEKKEKFRAEIAYQLLKIEFNTALLATKNYPPHIKSMPNIDNSKTEREAISYLLKQSRSFTEALKDYKSDYGHTEYGQKVIRNSIIFSL